jgi:hypothetical protein
VQHTDYGNVSASFTAPADLSGDCKRLLGVTASVGGVAAQASCCAAACTTSAAVLHSSQVDSSSSSPSCCRTPCKLCGADLSPAAHSSSAGDAAHVACQLCTRSYFSRRPRRTICRLQCAQGRDDGGLQNLWRWSIARACRHKWLIGRTARLSSRHRLHRRLPLLQLPARHSRATQNEVGGRTKPTCVGGRTCRTHGGAAPATLGSPSSPRDGELLMQPMTLHSRPRQRQWLGANAFSRTRTVR